jgi:vitamin B12 transporter
MRHFLLIAGLLGGAVSAAAQPTPEPTEEDSRFEESLIVTASLGDESADRITASVEIIDREEIASRQATTVVELLRTVPGLTVMRSGSAGKVSSLFSRGTESDHTLALWNGLELNNPFFGGFDWSFLPTEGVQRIEIVRGPFSAVYGSEALGGVVQVLSGGRSGGALGLELGERGYERLGLDAGFGTDRAQFDVTGHVRRGDGEVENDFFDSEELALSARWSVIEGMTVSLLARMHESDNGIPFSGGRPSPERRLSWSERQFAVPVSAHLGRWEIDGRLARVSYTTAFTDPADEFGFTGYDTDSEADRVRASAVRHFATSSRLAFGAEVEALEVDDRSVFGTNLEGASQETTSSFFEVAHDLGRVRVDVGARYDDNDAFGSRLTPRVGVLVPLSERTTFRASWGEGFRAPSIGELFYPFSGNTNLEPEESESWELGIESRRESWSFGATGFDTRIENLIDFDFLTFTNRNVGRASSRGVELWGRYSSRLLSITANATLIDTEDLDSGEALLRRPDESASMVLVSGPGDWDLSFTATFVGERADVDAVTFGRVELDSHLLFDVAGRFEGWRRFQPYARIENVTDESYQEVAGFPAPGQQLILGLSMIWE